MKTFLILSALFLLVGLILIPIVRRQVKRQAQLPK